MRLHGKFQPSGESPHPTPLRGAAFSHKWEKDSRPCFLIAEVESNGGNPLSRPREKVARRSRVG